MPAQEHMTWNPSQKRWLKKYRGKMYSVSPRQLKSPPTKDGSRQAANQWWEAKQRELDDEQADGKRHPAHIREVYQHAIHRHELYAKWQRQFGSVEEAQYADGMKVKGKAKKGLKAFRKTGSTLLEQSTYGRCVEHYLGEAPQTVASRHYAHKNGAEFDQAIKWLGEQLGIE